MERPASCQENYYARTAATYDEAHVTPGDEHYVALEYVLGICETVQASSVLEVGAGTGRAMAFLRDRNSSLAVVGIEPSLELRDQATVRGVTDILAGVGEDLQFEDDSFDVVMATAVMHHVQNPNGVIAEMVRVARKAVLISDANRYGQSRGATAMMKIALWSTGLWGPYNWIRTRGKGHLFSEGDGVYYSYSIYDSIPQLVGWTNRVFVIPTSSEPPRRWSGPLLTNSQGMVVAIKEPCFLGWAETE